MVEVLVSGVFQNKVYSKNQKMDGLRCYVPFNSFSVISGRWEDDNEKLCANEPRLRISRLRLERGSNNHVSCQGYILQTGRRLSLFQLFLIDE